MKILIKGAGDLATGIACRLRACGHDILMTEIAVPTTVRRTVAFSAAVYEGSAEVEGITAVLVRNIDEACNAFTRGSIAVIVDENASIISEYRPDVLVDAILAKRNLGTRKDDAPLVIGVGPGFEAGTDCDCVIETKRGHYLGRVIREGSAFPNTGIPGDVGGYSIERIIRAEAAGEFHPLHMIGDFVEKGETVAEAGGIPIKALMPGIIRGMLQEGVAVTPGMKCGDIDARCEPAHCYTVSDKARAIGGGVLEAISAFEHRCESLGIVLLAAGEGRRYGSNKLIANINGRRMFEYCVDACPGLRRTIVTGYEEVAEYARSKGFEIIYNREPELGISRSLQLGLCALTSDRRKCPKPFLNCCDAVLFAVCDQPGIRKETFEKLIYGYAASEKGLAALGRNGEPAGNPCIFSRKYFSELMGLTGDVGGKRIIRQHSDDLVVIAADAEELKDIDTKQKQ